MSGDPPAEPASRTGVAAGLAAYSLWGVFPLVFHLLASVAAVEVLAHRVVWSFVVVAALLAATGQQGFVRSLLRDRRQLAQLVLAGFLIAANWLVYIWAVTHGHVVEAALGYYVNPLLMVAVGIVVLGERLRPLQLWALGVAVVAVAVLTAAYGRPPVIAVVLACTFAAYGYLKKSVRVSPTQSLAVETAALLPFALVGLVALQVGGRLAFAHGSAGRTALLAGLGVVTALPLLLFGTAARHMPLSLLGLIQYLTPTLQLVIGVVVLGEPLPPARLAGFALIWVALALLGADAVRHLRSPRTAAPVPLAEPV